MLEILFQVYPVGLGPVFIEFLASHQHLGKIGVVLEPAGKRQNGGKVGAFAHHDLARLVDLAEHVDDHQDVAVIIGEVGVLQRRIVRAVKRIVLVADRPLHPVGGENDRGVERLGQGRAAQARLYHTQECSNDHCTGSKKTHEYAPPYLREFFFGKAQHHPFTVII